MEVSYKKLVHLMIEKYDGCTVTTGDWLFTNMLHGWIVTGIVSLKSIESIYHILNCKIDNITKNVPNALTFVPCTGIMILKY